MSLKPIAWIFRYPTRWVGCCLVVISLQTIQSLQATDLTVYQKGQLPNDRRLLEPKDLDGYFPFEVPSSQAAWEARAEQLRRRVKIATHLWPMPARTPLNAVIHGKVQRPGFTVEKVYFESIPNHFVTGLLFRPDDGKQNVKRPAILCPHGHGGRMQSHSPEQMVKFIANGAEKFAHSGRFPKLARCAQLARMGCVTFIYDMLGYADSTQIDKNLAHRFAKQRPEFENTKSWGLYSTQAELRLQSIMGIQTWNSIRCLDFLEQLPEVDGQRMAVTGGSGGGTQTIVLGAIDPRPITAFPNGMVSTSMQGGCTCENCTLLRIDTGNVELAALFAPKPLAMTAANDWTREMMTKGYPELQQLYSMLGVKDNVHCLEMLQYPHNYNYVARMSMYQWFNKHMQLQLEEPLDEQDWEPLSPAESTVWNEKHPQPEGGESYERQVTRYLAETSDQQMAQLAPSDSRSLKTFQEVVGGAFRSILRREVPDHSHIQRTKIDKQQQADFLYFEDILRLQTHEEELPVISLFPKRTTWNGSVVIWVDGQGKRGMFDAAGQPRAEVRRLLDRGTTVLAADLFQQGEFLSADQPLEQQRVVKNPREVAAYTFCYNDTLFARRVHDILTLISFVRYDEHTPQHLHLIGVNGGGALVAAARVIAGDKVDKAAIDTEGFRFANLTSYRDPAFLPGAVKYGDLPGLLALSAPCALWVGGEHGNLPDVVTKAYAAAGATDQIVSSPLQNTADAAVTWLMSP